MNLKFYQMINFIKYFSQYLENYTWLFKYIDGMVFDLWSVRGLSSHFQSMLH